MALNHMIAYISMALFGDSEKLGNIYLRMPRPGTGAGLLELGSADFGFFTVSSMDKIRQAASVAALNKA